MCKLYMCMRAACVLYLDVCVYVCVYVDRDQPDSSPIQMLTVRASGFNMVRLRKYIAFSCSLSHQKGAWPSNIHDCFVLIGLTSCLDQCPAF